MLAWTAAFSVVAACSHAGGDVAGSDAHPADAEARDARADGSSHPGPDSRTPDAAVTVPSAREGWWRDDVFYEIFVRSFADSNGDGVGDFVGLTQHLDVLNDGDPETHTDLGITGIWLMPVFESPSYHGYDVTDYLRINPDYGTQADFEAFLAAAHERGIRVILDLMINHSSNQHPWFRSAREGEDAPYRDYYLWRSNDPGWTQPWSNNPVWHRANGDYYYGLFWSGMPDLNLANPEVEGQIVEIMKHWLDQGVDGFRLDAARHYFESEDGVLVDQPEVHPFMRRLRLAVAREHPSALFVAEVWSDLSTVARYYGDDGDQFQLAFGFSTADALLNSARDRTAIELERVVRRQRSEYADPNFEAPFITNHDMPRIMRQLDGDEGAMRVAAAGLFAMPGTPFIYYGEEIGMRGGPQSRDEDKRTPMRWTAEGPGYGFTTAAAPWHGADEPAGVDVASQRGAEGSLWTLYRDLVATRRSSPALSDGEVDLPPVQSDGRGGTAILRTTSGERMLVVFNFDADRLEGLTVEIDGEPHVRFAEGLEAAPEVQNGQLRFRALAGRALAFIELR